MGDANEPRSECPINAAIEVFGDRWSLLVLRDIVFGDRRYFRQLQAGSEEEDRLKYSRRPTQATRRVTPVRPWMVAARSA